MSLLRFCQWLASTRGSIALHESLWGYPAIATVHMMALPLFVGMIAILDLRLLGVRMPDVPVSEIAQRLLPWVAGGFVVLILSGSLLFYADPIRYYPNIFLRLKLALLVASGVNAWGFHRSGYLTAAERGLNPASRGAKAAGLLSLLLLAAIILAERLIAYYDEWFDCGRHPHSAIVTFIGGCAASR